ncbi:MAG: hypothetical protein CVV23_09930 [Ignavibacteriae bacterium HGW-Ignavibacteriae-2]|jgi:PAS domain S-box-containing protein|nr:MAG: hypothetical protein CVV23_09930 [Ignavibacteriae bacterium HGW-Ignavibacteriae-2]
MSNFEKEQSDFNLKLFEYTINSIHECIVITDRENNIIFINDAFEKVYGFERSEILGQSIDKIRSDRNDPSLYRKLHDGTRKLGWSGRLYNKRKNGEEFLVSLQTFIVRDKNKNEVALVGTSVDLSEQIEQEKILKETEDKYRILFTDLKETVYESSPEGRIIDINPSGIELFGYNSKEEILKLDIAKDLYLNDNDRALFKKELEEKGFVKNYEIKIKNRNGEIINVLETSTAVKDSKGEIVCYRGILRDITESKKNHELLNEYLEKLSKMNEQLRDSESKLKKSNTEKDKFFSIIAHDLRSPFNSLLGLSEFLVQDINELTPEEIKSYAIDINAASKNVFNLLENLLQWSLIQTDRIEQNSEIININELVKQIILLLKKNAELKGVLIQSKILNDCFVIADKNMIGSVIQNLVSNAIKFTNQGDCITIAANAQQENVLISISDTGIGMTEEIRSKLFRIDYHHSTRGTKDESGTGLGLILCKELVEKNNGKIWVESKIRVGSTFYFTVPKA